VTLFAIIDDLIILCLCFDLCERVLRFFIHSGTEIQGENIVESFRMRLFRAVRKVFCCLGIDNGETQPLLPQTTLNCDKRFNQYLATIVGENEIKKCFK
jgi:hypothetical protein